MNCTLRRSLIIPLRTGSTTVSKRHLSLFGYTQAKALVYSKYGNPKDVLSLHQHSISPPFNEEITVRFLAAPINPADINQIEGVYPAKPPFTTALGTNDPSAVAGNEGVIEVLSTGSKVKDFKRGDRAIMRHTGFGTWRTHASTSPANLLKIPSDPNITTIQAATISVNPCTAYRMLKDFTTMEKGDWFIQNGANSGVGRSAIQLGRLWGLKSINVVRNRDRLEELKEELKGLGADMVVTEEELADRGFWGVHNEKTEGGEVKLGLNCVGGKPTLDLARRLGHGGHLITYGAMARQPLKIPAGLLIFSDIHFHGFWVSIWSDRHPEEKQTMIDELFGYIKSGEFKDIPVEETVWRSDTKVEELKDAIERSGQGFGGKKQVFIFEE